VLDAQVVSDPWSANSADDVVGEAVAIAAILGNVLVIVAVTAATAAENSPVPRVTVPRPQPVRN